MIFNPFETIFDNLYRVQTNPGQCHDEIATNLNKNSTNLNIIVSEDHQVFHKTI